ncbi:fibronectin type III domain-containing protein [Streptomyces jeddahensis]|uniref:PA14 domain protein n=1 Tax=Streptomyces jeddahensis TaxID=1716141 RepID=A0A177HHE0_9ACTN|nr:PA14 domain-containing protein [Streptomyces jeddahensis]OAH09598.1 PA14 domain protein [Streptomyces jeddahensis]
MTTRARTTAVSAAVVLATAGGLLTAVSASAAVSCTSPVYKRQFFANTTFSGTPKKTDCDSKIDQNWGTGAPASGLPSNNFGVRWTVTRDFGSGGPFAFSVESRDGIRVYLDGVRKVDLWKNVSTTQKKTVNVTIPSGKHTLRIDFVNWTGAANVKFTYAPRTSADVDKVKPLAPTGFTAAYANDTQQAKLTWSKNVEMDLAGYRVYQRVAGTTSWLILRELGATTTSYTDTPPATGETYEYMVRAYDKARNYSADTSRATVTSIAVTTPTGLTATGTDAGIALRWDAVPGAVKYRVVRSSHYIDGGATWQPTGTSLTDTSVTRSAQHEYRVAAIDASGRVTAYSTAKTARRLVAAPTIGKAFPHTSAVTVTWDADHKTGGSYSGFRIYRATGTSTDWVEVTERCHWTERELPDGTDQYLCTDWSAGTNTAYRYAVSGYDVNDREGLRSGEVTATTGTDKQAPAAPASVTATTEDWGTTLTWSQVADADLDEYSVWRGTTVDGVCTDTEKLGDTRVTETSWRDVNVADGESLCYVVRPADFAGNLSAGTTVHVTEHDLRPTVETPAGATHAAYASLSAIGNVQVSAWSPAGTEEYASFRAARWNPGTATFDALPASDPLYDASVPTGTSLWYQVVGVHEDGTTSLPVLVSVAVPPSS